MLHLGTIYLIVKNMAKSIAFYETLLAMSVTTQNDSRWAEFDIGETSISLLNPEYDQQRIASGKNLDKCYNPAYVSYIKKTNIKYGNNMVLNFWVEDLNFEYERIKRLKIGAVSDILFINVVFPYYCFIIEDPDGNIVEITGPYEPE